MSDARVVAALCMLACATGCSDDVEPEEEDATVLEFDIRPKDAGKDTAWLDVTAPDVICKPGAIRCDADGAYECNLSGTAWDPGKCDTELGLACDVTSGLCEGPCSDTQLARSYIGCEYWATQTSNSLLNPAFQFAVAIASASTETAQVVIRRGKQIAYQGTLAPGQVLTVPLPWVLALKGASDKRVSGNPLDLDLRSALVPDGAFHIKSTRPITASQFNPLEFQVPATATCAASGAGGKCPSYTNDAAMLLPANTLGTTYVAASLPSGVWLNAQTPTLVGTQPGFVTVVASRDRTNVHIHARGAIRTGSGVPAIKAGQDADFFLNAGDVLQLLTGRISANDVAKCLQTPNAWCKAPATFDLTGSVITADRPIQVLGGHDCANVPFDKRACDHVEESITPLATWGSTALVAAPQSIQGASKADGSADTQYLRIISGAENNEITAIPPMPELAGKLLQIGDVVDLPLTATQVAFSGTGRFLVVQVMVGAEALAGGGGLGDPSLSLVVPQEQYRDNYTFLVPATYTWNFANVLAPLGSVLTLDGKVLQAKSTPVAASGFGVMRVPVAGGNHVLAGSAPFGLTVYGYALYTSYMYPGGLNLKSAGKL